MNSAAGEYRIDALQQRVHYEQQGVNHANAAVKKEAPMEPAGALFEATVSKPEGFLIDERYEELGSRLQIPLFKDREQNIASYLEKLQY